VPHVDVRHAARRRGAQPVPDALEQPVGVH
jgi:hypothetical protein